MLPFSQWKETVSPSLANTTKLPFYWPAPVTMSRATWPAVNVIYDIHECSVRRSFMKYVWGRMVHACPTKYHVYYSSYIEAPAVCTSLIVVVNLTGVAGVVIFCFGGQPPISDPVRVTNQPITILRIHLPPLTNPTSHLPSVFRTNVPPPTFYHIPSNCLLLCDSAKKTQQWQPEDILSNNVCWEWRLWNLDTTCVQCKNNLTTKTNYIPPYKTKLFKCLTVVTQHRTTSTIMRRRRFVTEQVRNFYPLWCDWLPLCDATTPRNGIAFVSWRMCAWFKSWASRPSSRFVKNWLNCRPT